MSALCGEPKTCWIYKEPVRSFLHFPHSYKSQTLSKYTAPNDFTTTIRPLQFFTHNWIFTVLLHCSVHWQWQPLWKYNKTEGRARITACINSLYVFEYPHMRFRMIYDQNTSNINHILRLFPSESKSGMHVVSKRSYFSLWLLSINTE